MQTLHSYDDPWQVRFAWFWINSKEILEFSQSDMDAKVKFYADQGITHLITFSCTHFRWSYRPWWKEIQECLVKVVRAAHARGMKVIDHHSSCLTYFPEPGTFGHHDDFLKTVMKTHGSSIEDWPGFVAYNLDESKRESQWEQVDAVTGEKISTWYHGHIKCPNNPEYLKEYLDYLDTLYDTGIDGVMTDDMQFANQNVYQPDGSRNNRLRSCGCQYCREAFQKQYGYELPAPDKWDVWFGKMTDPTFVDYLNFRRESCLKFHRAVKERYEARGLTMLRPNYNSTPIQNNPRGTFPGIFPALDWFFQECQVSHIISCSWPRFLVEQQMIEMYAEARGIPHMMLFYADRQDSLNFVFGLARLAGAMFTNTPEIKGPVDESVIRRFEVEHAEAVFHSKRMASIGFIDSEKNRFDSVAYGESRFYFWMQAVWLKNLPSVLYRLERPEDWKTPVLVVNEVHLLTLEEIERLKEYADRGGTLVLTGICGEQSKAAVFRTLDEVNRCWGVALDDEANADGWHCTPYGSGRICTVGYNFGYPGTKEENYHRFVQDERRKKSGFCSRKEECTAVPLLRMGEVKECPFPPGVRLYSRNLPYFEKIVAFLQELAGDALTFHADVPDLVLAVPCYSEKLQSVTIHILNASDTMPKTETAMLSHDYPIPYPQHDGTAQFTLKMPQGMTAHTAVWEDLAGHRESLELTCQPDGRIVVNLPLRSLKDYGIIQIA